MSEKITVSDIVGLHPIKVRQLSAVMSKLNSLTTDYKSCDDLASLESIKREFNGHLQYMATIYSRVKVYKGPNHTYLEEAIKRIKAETLELIMKEGGTVTSAERLVPLHPYYTARMDVVESIKQFCIRVELKYDQYNTTLQCIVQSVSVASKELSNQKSIS